MTAPLRVMVVDDTITYRMIMKNVAESIPGVQVVTSANNGRVALEKVQRDKLDVVLLDVEMPVMDGLETLKHLTANHPEITVVMVSGTSRSNANIILDCLGAGALDFVTKPVESNATRAKEALRQDLEPILSVIRQKRAGGKPAAPNRIAALGTDRSVRPAAAPVAPAPAPHRTPVRTPVPPPPAPPVTQVRGTGPAANHSAIPHPRPANGRTVKPVAPDLLLIGSSTGGPAALAKVLSTIGRRLTVPGLIVQHMPPVFTASLALQLSRSSGLEVLEAQEGLRLQPGRIILAQGGRHMTLRQGAQGLEVGLNDGPKVNECRPAVDVLFMSALAAAPGHTLSVILTGMGRDGANGVKALKQSGKNYCLTQDEQSCVVFGMPRSVEEMGLSDESLPLDRIGPRIVEICG
ncbi:MAG: chemotaxis-specific protein-glutamate methyltransferase CheB [Magnetococcales bacterium]|nr:chemotaxis-specific protein-glutamate methyltransferase CheB [Magnetococcales bacterium]